MVSRRLRLHYEEAGQDLVEYALLAGLVALVAGAVLLNLGPAVGSAYSSLVSGAYGLWQPPAP